MILSPRWNLQVTDNSESNQLDMASELKVYKKIIIFAIELFDWDTTSSDLSIIIVIII